MNISKSGKLEVIFGSMFSGKSEEMIRRLRRGEIVGQKIMLFKPEIDTRYNNEIKTHDGKVSMTAQVIKNIEEIHTLVTQEISIVGIDETQFFKGNLIPVINQLIKDGKRVICSGLDMWANGQPIEMMGNLSCIADEVTKLKAVCACCGNDAYISHKKGVIESTVDIGGSDKYTALCRNCSNRG